MTVRQKNEAGDVVKVGTVTLRGTGSKETEEEEEDIAPKLDGERSTSRHYDPLLSEGDSSGDVGIKLCGGCNMTQVYLEN